MKAELVGLEGKYYGTEITVKDDDGNSVGGMSIWLTPAKPEDYKPSERELKGWDEYWKSEGETTPEYEVSDSHYECALTLAIANKIVGAINGSVSEA